MSLQVTDWMTLSDALPQLYGQAHHLDVQHKINTYENAAVVTCCSAMVKNPFPRTVVVGDDYLLGALYITEPYGTQSRSSHARAIATPVQTSTERAIATSVQTFTERDMAAPVRTSRQRAIAQYRRKRLLRRHTQPFTYACRQRFARSRVRVRGRFV